MIEALGIAMVKNEADIIEAFVRHNLGFMDALVIVDNDSVDGTREIIVQLQREGLPLILLDDPVVGLFHAEIITAVYRKVVPEFEPRFVFMLDADEFIATSSREELYIQLRAMRPGTQAQYHWRTYIPAPTGPEGDASDPLRSITHRKIVEDLWWKTIIITKPRIDRRLKIQQGGHDVTYAGRPLRKIELRDVALAHFPVRSVDQLTGKVLVGWTANLERNRHLRDRGQTIHLKPLYERILNGPVFTDEDLTLEALRYAQLSGREFTWPLDVVHDPIKPAYKVLTAFSTDVCTPLQKVVRSVDKLFNPVVDPSYDAIATQFLHNRNRMDRNRARRKFRSSVFSFQIGTKPDKVLRGFGSGANLYVDLPPFRYLAHRYRPTSVLNIGCGSGAYLKYFNALGTDRILGVDNFDGTPACLQPDEYIQRDISKPLELLETFDLVICVEDIAHSTEPSDRILIENIVRHARDRIVFGAGRAGQPRRRQNNRQSVSHWLDLFATAGWHPCLFDSLTLRSLSTFSWFRGNLILLTRDNDGSTMSNRRLIKLEGKKIKLSKQRPAVITHSFTETTSKLLAAGKGSLRS